MVQQARPSRAGSTPGSPRTRRRVSAWRSGPTSISSRHNGVRAPPSIRGRSSSVEAETTTRTRGPVTRWLKIVSVALLSLLGLALGAGHVLAARKMERKLEIPLRDVQIVQDQ